MAQGQKSNAPLIRQASQGLNSFKWEVANELGVQVPADGYMGDIPSRVNGAIGGHMVRRMIAAAEQSLINQAAANVSAGFKAGLGGGQFAGGTNWGVANPATIASKNNPNLTPSDI